MNVLKVLSNFAAWELQRYRVFNDMLRRATRDDTLTYYNKLVYHCQFMAEWAMDEAERIKESMQ